jgi:hypothetical protein
MLIPICIALPMLRNLFVCVQGSGYAEAGDAQAALRCWEQAALVRLPAAFTLPQHSLAAVIFFNNLHDVTVHCRVHQRHAQHHA